MRIYVLVFVKPGCKGHSVSSAVPSRSTLLLRCPLVEVSSPLFKKASGRVPNDDIHEMHTATAVHSSNRYLDTTLLRVCRGTWLSYPAVPTEFWFGFVFLPAGASTYPTVPVFPVAMGWIKARGYYYPVKRDSATAVQFTYATCEWC